jgi:hypothetical protein
MQELTMSVLLSLSFTFPAIAAVAAMIASWNRYRPTIAALRHALRQPPATVALRVSISDRTPAAASPRQRRARPHSRPKPVRHRLRRFPSRAVG